MKVHIGRSTGRSIPPGNCHLVVRNGNFTFLATMRVHIAISTGRSTSPHTQDCHLVVKNGNFTCLSTIRVHIGRSTGRYIFCIRTSSHSCNYDTTLLNISDTSVHHIWVRLQWINIHCVAYASSDATDTPMETSTPHFSPAIESKISAVSYDNPAWHTGFCKEGASATSCKIFQTLYLYLDSTVLTY